MTDKEKTPVKADDASDTADNNASLNKQNTIKGLVGTFLTHTTISGVSYPTYRLQPSGTDGAKLTVGDKVSFTASARKHTGLVKAITGDNKLDVVFCDVRIT